MKDFINARPSLKVKTEVGETVQSFSFSSPTYGIVSRDEIFILRVLKNQLSTVVCMSAVGFHNVWLPT
jgi:hypothetical protein